MKNKISRALLVFAFSMASCASSMASNANDTANEPITNVEQNKLQKMKDFAETVKANPTSDGNLELATMITQALMDKSLKVDDINTIATSAYTDSPVAVVDLLIPKLMVGDKKAFKTLMDYFAVSKEDKHTVAAYMLFYSNNFNPTTEENVTAFIETNNLDQKNIESTLNQINDLKSYVEKGLFTPKQSW